jgi:hypothetical protein
MAQPNFLQNLITKAFHTVAQISSAKLLMEKVANFVRQNRCTLVETVVWKGQTPMPEESECEQDG